MDTTVQTLKREVALDSEQGTDLEKLWVYVKIAQQETVEQYKFDCSDIVVDRPLKEYLWPIILRISGLIFEVNDTVVYDTSAAPATPTIQNKFDKFSKLSLNQVESKYPGLIVRGSHAVINKELYGTEQGNRRVTSSVLADRVLKVISRAKQKGITQRAIAKELEIDSRSTFSFVRILECEGLIVKLPIYEEGCNTNLLLLRRYQGIYLGAEYTNGAQNTAPVIGNSEQQAGGNDGEEISAQRDNSYHPEMLANMAHSRFRKRLSDYMQNLEASYIVDLDLLDAMDIDFWNMTQRKFFQRIVNRMCEDGYIECVRVMIPDPDYVKPSSPPASKDDRRDSENEDSDSSSHVALSESGPGSEGDEVADDESEECKTTMEESNTNPNQRMYPIKTRARKKVRSTREGYMYRRCYRFLKPYVRKSKIIASVGIPLQQISRDSGLDAENETLPMAEDDDASDSEAISDLNSSSDEGSPRIDDTKERDEIKYLLTKPQVKFGELACLSMEAQIFRLIALSGSHGTVVRALEYFVTNLDFRSITRVVNRLESTLVFRPDGSIPGIHTTASQREQNKSHLGEKLITIVEEFIGREHRKRIFANPIAQPLIALFTAEYSGITSDPIIPLVRLEKADASTDDPAATAPEPRAVDANDRAENSDVHLDPNTSDLAAESEALAGNAAEQTDKEGKAASAAREAMDAEYGSIQGILDEAERRRLTALSVLRERIILRVLEKESIFNCTPRKFAQFEELIKQYVLANKDLHAVAQNIFNSISKHTVDKTTYIRVLEKLATQKRLWMQTVVPTILKASRSVPATVKIVIARQVDPKGPLVDMFIQSLHDERKYYVQSAPTVPKLIDKNIDVPRTEGAEERDRDFRSRVREDFTSRAKRAWSVFSGALDDTARVDKRTSKRSKATENVSYRKKRPTLVIQNPSDETDLQATWSQVSKRLDYVPLRIGRLVDLFEYLCENLPKQIDNVYVFNNYGFRSGYLFSYVSLELYMEMTSGSMTMPEARYYIRYGIVPTEADLESESENEDDHTRVQGTLEEMMARLLTPIKDLPPAMKEIIDRHTVRARQHIQRLVSGLYILQLIRPVTNAKEITTLPPPPDAKDAFNDVIVDNPKLLNFGYQLIGRARLLKCEGYLQVLNMYQQRSQKKIDMTKLYLNDESFDLHRGTGLFQYFKELEISSREQCREFTTKHPLYGIAFSNYWHRRYVLLTSQTEILDRFVDASALSTPLDDVDRLKVAADEAGATLDEARKYYQQVFTSLCRVENRKKSERIRQENAIRKKIEEAKKQAAVKAAMRQEAIEKGFAVDDDDEEVRARRIRWSEDETRLVSIYFAVIRTHAREHNHPFALRDVTTIFPSRLKTSQPVDSLRRHWRRMQSLPDYKNLSDNLDIVWVHVLGDAIDEDLLDDDPDFEKFDIPAAVDYFRRKLISETLDGLIEKYADDIIADGGLLPFGTTKQFNQKAKPKPAETPRSAKKHEAKAKIKTKSKSNSKAVHPKPQKVQLTYLPTTMKGSEHRYVISAGKTKETAYLYEYTEDAYREVAAAKKYKSSSMYTMLTTHSGWSGVSDYSSPVITLLCSGQNQDNTDAMDVDQSSSLQRTTTTKIVARAAESVSYPDPLESLCPITRTLSISNITEWISQLALGKRSGSTDTTDDSDRQDGQNDSNGSSGYRKNNAERWYADVASLQAMIINLTLTPDDEYDVGVGQMLLSAKTDTAVHAFNLLSRKHIIYQLRGMVSSIGLSSSTEPSQLTAANDAGSTVVLHETTGITRVSVQPASSSSGKGVERETMVGVDTDACSASTGNAHMESGATQSDGASESTGASAVQKKHSDERRVPGRGYAISEQFLNTIQTTLPGSFIHGQRNSRSRGSATLDLPLESSEFWHLCQRIGAGSLWLRPSYMLESEIPFSALTGFRRQAGISIVDFGINVVEDDATDLGTQDWHALLDKSDLESTGDSAFSTIGLSAKHLALVSGVVAGTMQLMGPLGTTLHELVALFAIILHDANSSKALSLLPASVREMLGSRERLSALLRMMAVDKKVFMVGSSDTRYVSSDTYNKHWSIKLDEPHSMTFVSRIGQSFNGSTITKYTFGVMTTIAGHVFDNPGISQATLMRRYFAPFVSKAEVAYYLDKLVALGIIDVETAEIDNTATENDSLSGDPGVITYYSMADGYYHPDKGHGLRSKKTSTGVFVGKSDVSVDQREKERDNGEEESQDTQAERMRTRQDANPEHKLALQRLMEAFREGDFDSDLDDGSSDAENTGEDESVAKDVKMTRAKKAVMARRRAKQRKQKSIKEHNRGESDSDYVQAMENDEAEEEEEEDQDEEDDDAGSKGDNGLAESNGGSDQEKETSKTVPRKFADKASKSEEKRLILKFKMAKLAKTNGTSRNTSNNRGAEEDAPRLEDIDWSEFDLQTINSILARREELRKKRRRAVMKGIGAEDDGQITTSKLKKSSLAPAPLQLERVGNGKEPVSNNVEAVSEQHTEEQQENDQERYEAEKGNSEAMDVDVEGDRPELRYLFDSIEAAPLSPGGSSLQLPPRTSAMNPEGMDVDADSSAFVAGMRHGRPHPAFIRSIADSHLGTPRDMRIVLQYELKSEERVLKDIRAEILDKLSKLHTEEKLLRMIVKKDIDIEDDEAATQNAGDVSAVFNGYIDNDASGSGKHAPQSIAVTQGLGEHVGFEFETGTDVIANAGAADEEDGTGGSDSDDSLSGMSSSSSEDEVPDDEVTRGALSRVFKQYLPDESVDENLGP
ncbi:hypothetical protein EV179_000931 [Coemansia sp. RSA 487]|nr:hypothetical protein LPJ74_002035 [Coemansia sp. RSA 1843]KAJ2216897.1 hypothetical protein EV179_000931 [Coemansia sp. RSA 487]